MGKEFTWSEIEVDDHVLNYYGYYGKEELGYIDYYKSWKKFVWNQGEDIIMSEGCLQNVLDKIKELTIKDRVTWKHGK